MPKKYLKGKDGKFTGSVPNPPALSSGSQIQLPSIPALTTPNASQQSATGLLGTITSRAQNAPEPTSNFYSTSQDMNFKIPEKFERALSVGDRAYVIASHILFVDSYGNNIAAYQPQGAPRRAEDLINLQTVAGGSIAKNINEAEDFADLSDDVHKYFKYGGCASLAIAIYEQLPGSTLTVALGVPKEGNPEEVAAAHVFVMKDSLIYDSYGITEATEYDYSKAADLDSSEYEILPMEINIDSLNKMVSSEIFGNAFRSDSAELINKVASLVILKKTSPLFIHSVR